MEQLKDSIADLEKENKDLQAKVEELNTLIRTQ
jgi:cell division protein FtsB